MHPQSKSGKLAQLERLCREKGIPLTVQRRVIFEAAMERDDHPTADQIYDVVHTRIPGVSKTTVYRVLDKFVQMRLIRPLNHSGSSLRFDPKTHQHHHLVCVQCGHVADLEDHVLDSLPLTPNLPNDFSVTDYSIHFFGLCKECGGGGQVRMAKE